MGVTGWMDGIKDGKSSGAVGRGEIGVEMADGRGDAGAGVVGKVRFGTARGKVRQGMPPRMNVSTSTSNVQRMMRR